jgi:YteA family regulatory protein
LDKERLRYFEGKLLDERKKINGLLKQMREHDTIDTNIELASELSFYDNHSGDNAGDIYDMERGMAFKKNEISIIEKIDSALNDVKEGKYGKCKMCGKDIPEDRLEFIPYAECCVDCQRKLNNMIPNDNNNRPPEEDVIGPPFGFGYHDNDFYDDVEYDAEDSYQDVQRYNRRRNIVEFYEDDPNYVEPIEKISNEQYKNQLPD